MSRTPQVISAAKLAQLLHDASGGRAGPTRKSAPVLVDCREPDEHALCRIDKALLLPLSALLENGERHLKDKARTYVVFCHHGMRSQRAVVYLRRRGYLRAFSLEGGIDQWAREIDPEMPRY